MKTYIAPSYLKRPLLKHLTKRQAVLYDVRVLSPSAYVNNYIDYDEDLLDLRKKIEKLTLNELKDVYKERSFLQDVYRDRKILDIYAINDIAVHDDYRKILNAADRYPKDELNKLLEKKDQDIIVIDGDYDIFESYIVDKLIGNGARKYTYEVSEHKESHSKFVTLKQAIDKIIDKIIDEDLKPEDCLIMADPSDYRLLDIHLNKAGLPVHFLKPFKENYKAKALISIVEMYLHFDVDHYIDLVDHEIFKVKDQKSLKLYLKDHLETMTTSAFCQLSDQDAYYKKLEIRADNGHKTYVPLLSQLAQAKDLKEAITIAFDTIKGDDDETKSIKKIIGRYRDHLDEGYDLLKSELSQLKETDHNGGIDVIAYGMTYPAPKHLFVLDPNTNKYPRFNDLKGFINEEVVKDTAVPSLSTRFHRHKENYRIFENSEETVFIYIDSTLDGKKVQYEPSFNVPKKAIIMPLNERKIRYDRTLDDPSIFFDGEVLSGSVSAFERYFKCPYLYFLQKGIGLYSPMTKGLDAATVGTIYHAILEELVRRHDKLYPESPADEIDELALKHERELIALFPHQKGRIKVMIAKVKKSLMLELMFLKGYEDTIDEYRPAALEEEINDTVLNGKIKIHGYIDRIDKSDHSDKFRVIDYKTGARTISNISIAKGESLQLLTYALLYAQAHDLEPSAVLYIVTKHSSLTFKSYNATKTKGIEHRELSDEEIKDAFVSAHKASGLIFDDKDDVKDQMNYISKGKSGNGVWADRDKTFDLLKDIYIYLYDTLKKGDISLVPKTDACKYCDFKKICHFKGIYDMRNGLISAKEIKHDESE